jgi:hypothetical protein
VLSFSAIVFSAAKAISTSYVSRQLKRGTGLQLGLCNGFSELVLMLVRDSRGAIAIFTLSPLLAVAPLGWDWAIALMNAGCGLEAWESETGDRARLLVPKVLRFWRLGRNECATILGCSGVCSWSPSSSSLNHSSPRKLTRWRSAFLNHTFSINQIVLEPTAWAIVMHQPFACDRPSTRWADSRKERVRLQNL